MMDVNMGLQPDGTTYRLAPGVRERILARYPSARPAGHSVFVSHDTHDDFQYYHGSMWAQLAILLTGLSHTQIKELGGIRFVSLPDRVERGRFLEAG
jgi:hypothetical protein